MNGRMIVKERREGGKGEAEWEERGGREIEREMGRGGTDILRFCHT